MPPAAVRGRIAAVFDAIERRPGLTITAIGLVFALAYAVAFLSGTSRGHVMRGDAIQYYAYLRSAVFDGDLDFQNEYEHFYDTPSEAGRTNVWLTERTATGRPPNMMSVGPALLWSPLYIAAVALTWMLAFVGLASPPDGYSTGLQLTAGLAGIAYATAGAWLAYRSARRLFDAPSAFWATVVAWLAGPAIYYSVISPTYSHATSLFAVALFVFIWLRSLGRYELTRAALLGLAAGLAALVRWQDVIVLLLPAWELLVAPDARRIGWRRRLAFGAIVGLAVSVALIPQVLAWQAVYGSPLVMPQGGSFMRWSEPAILSVLFSTRHGLFLWTPALLVATVGLWWLPKRDGLVGGAVMLTLAAALYVNAAVSDWWAGEAFGARRFISYTPLFTLGLAALGAMLERTGRLGALRAAGIGLIVYNGLFLLQYQLFMRGHTALVPYPDTVKRILFDRLLLPFRLMAAWMRAW